MIKCEKPEYYMTSCNSCRNSENLVKIIINHNKNQSSSFILCDKCVKELVVEYIKYLSIKSFEE